MANISDAFAIVRWESFVGLACLTPAVALMADHSFELLSARTVIILLLVWQAVIYLSAVLTSAWDYQQRRSQLAPAWLSFRTAGHTIGRAFSERRTAAWVGLVALVLGQLLYLASERAPTMERIFRADPLDQFLSDASVIPPTPAQRAGAVLVIESDAARRGDVDKALSLWSPNGVIVDENFSPGDAADDRVWRGSRGLRERYTNEFKERRYISVRHQNLSIKVEGEYATIINDLDAVVQSRASEKTQRVFLPQTDRWLLRHADGQWHIVRLEVNRAANAALMKRAANEATTEDETAQ